MSEIVAGADRRAPQVDLRQAVNSGFLGGIAVMFVAAIGMLESFVERSIIDPILTLGYLILFGIPLLISYLASRPPKPVEGLPPPTVGQPNVIAGLLTGAISGLTVTVMTLLLSALDQESLRQILLNITPTLYDILSLGLDLWLGLLLLLVLFGVLGALGGALHLLPERWAYPIRTTIVWLLGLGLLADAVAAPILRQLRLRNLTDPLFENGGLSFLGAVVVLILAFVGAFYMRGQRGKLQARIKAMPDEQQRRTMAGLYLLLAIAILVLPLLIGSFLSEVLDLVGIFAIMALGLNIVLGYAGMLDLGYVAFFAVGAYTTGVLSSTNAPGCQAVDAAGLCPEMNFWMTLPFVVIMAAIAGVIVGTPVIRMRGDYLAIVTLGFGEIARLIIQSDWFKPVLGAAQGVRSIPTITIGSSIELNSPPEFFYPILGFVIFSVYALWRLQGSRIGRAWMALREDERVAEVMGVNIVTTKLLAFTTGAILASFSGALFAAKLGSIFPNSFNIEKSIQVLIIVIVGGLGSIPGMIAASFLIIGVPELLRELDEFRFLAYGVLLVIMMLYRPEGLIPNRRIAHVLTEDESGQDAWLETQQTDADVAVE